MSKFRLDQIARNFQAMKRTLPPQVGNMGQRFFRTNFEKQGFQDTTLKRWQPRKGEIKGGIAMVSKEASKKSSRAILVKTGRLRNAVNRSLKSTEWSNISFNIPVPYAAVHNFGFSGVVYSKPHKRNASRTIRIKGGYSALGDEKGKGRKTKILGARHNVSGRAYRLNIPQRKFIGNSRTLFKDIDELVRKRLRGLRK